MGRKVFSDDDRTALVNAFDEFSVSVYGRNYAKKIRRMIDEVEAGKAARKSLIKNLSYDQINAIMETLPFEVTFVDAEFGRA